MAFPDKVIEALSAKLSEKHIRTRRQDGATLAYIEGWHAIVEANRIFGFDAWDRETVQLECVSKRRTAGGFDCAYLAKVRVTVRVGDREVCREGTGVGHGAGNMPGDAHESAVKEAETDAMKRALATFGNPFGLALYDRQQKGVRKLPKRRDGAGPKAPIKWAVFSHVGNLESAYAQPADYLGALRRGIDARSSADEVRRFMDANSETLAELAKERPDMTNGSGDHYVNVLVRYATRKASLVNGSPEPLKIAEPLPDERGPEVCNIAQAPSPSPRRLRDKAHLKSVANLPCVVCGRSPSHAHHIRYAQPRALGKKVSDEWVVPLCSLHHRALHDVGDEREWWTTHKLDPVEIAKDLWDRRLLDR